MAGSGFLTESLDHWRYIRGGLVAELQNIPADKFDFRATDEVKSVQELALHILEGSMMMVGELSRANPDFQRMPPQEINAEYSKRVGKVQGKSELVDLLTNQLEEGIAVLSNLGEEAMMQPVRNFDGSTWSRMQWFFHAMTEEMYHRGQLVTYARLMGLVPALTQRIEASND